MNKLITFNLSYYNQSKDILMKHINYWKAFPDEIRNLFTFFIIDDGSKFPVYDSLKDEDLSGIDLHIYRVKEDLYCNIAGVRNLGAKECKTPWIVILDMDTCIESNMAKSLIELAKQNLDKNNVFKFNRMVPNNTRHIKHLKPHPAVCLIRNKDYWNIGGCEEDLVGHYGQTDPSFWHRANGKVNVIYMNNIYLLYYPDGESDINRDTQYNSRLFEYKKKTNSWSNTYIRFTWEKIL